MPICPTCSTFYPPHSPQDPPEPRGCDCDSQPSPEDREPTEDELWERGAAIAGILTDYDDDPSGGQK